MILQFFSHWDFYGILLRTVPLSTLGYNLIVGLKDVRLVDLLQVFLSFAMGLHGPKLQTSDRTHYQLRLITYRYNI